MVGELLAEEGHDVTAEKVPFKDTGWGAMLSRKSLEEVEKAIHGIDFFYKISLENLDYIFDFHTTSERVLNYHNLQPEDLEFGRLDDDSLAKRGGIPYARWRDNNENLLNGFTIEIPQVYRKSSKKFIKMVEERTGLKVNYNQGVKPSQELESHFLHVCDKKKTLNKYPPEIIAKTIAEGIKVHIMK